MPDYSPSKHLAATVRRTENRRRRRDIIAQIEARPSADQARRSRTYRTAARYPDAPIPATGASTAGEATDPRLRPSLALALERWTSTFGTETASSASWMA